MKKIPEDLIDTKHQVLVDNLCGMGRVVVAYSGGVDSTLLLHVAHEALSKGDVLAVTAVSPLMSQREKADAVRLAQQIGVKHVIWQSGEMADPDFTRNPKDKCYLCKKSRFRSLMDLAKDGGYFFVVDGENVDDARDFRPGSLAARELGVRSPLKEAGLSKSEIRHLSKKLGLPTWSKPAAACLASRIPYHSPITVEKLMQVEAGEEFIRQLNISDQVRVRHHGDLARLEISPEALPELMTEKLRRKIVNYFKSLGFLFVTLDLEGYCTGSLNRAVAGENEKDMADGHQIP